MFMYIGMWFTGRYCFLLACLFSDVSFMGFLIGILWNVLEFVVVIPFYIPKAVSYLGVTPYLLTMVA
jgi:hypothetical protein